MKLWSELSNSQKNFYLEFYAPKRGMTCIIPRNNELIHAISYTPDEYHIDAVTVRKPKLKISLTEGQRNAIIDWLEENNPYQENEIYN